MLSFKRVKTIWYDEKMINFFKNVANKITWKNIF